MPHMSNLPWVTLYFFIAITLILFICKENIKTSHNQQNSLKSKSLQSNFKIWTW